ncbi:ABC transporter permease subunit, partial [Cronobacter sakazakii]
PYDEQWRPLLASILLTLLIVCSCVRWFWKPWLPVMWLVGLTVVGILMWGGVLGLSYVENSLWGGLPLTLILATFGIAFAFPLGLLLALGRTSRLPAVKAVCVVYIELIRGVPLISLLFMSSVMLPLFM